MQHRRKRADCSILSPKIHTVDLPDVMTDTKSGIYQILWDKNTRRG